MGRDGGHLKGSTHTWSSSSRHRSFPWICPRSAWAWHVGLLCCEGDPMGPLDGTLAGLSSPRWRGQIFALRLWYCCCDDITLLDKCCLLSLPCSHWSAWLPLQVQDPAGQEIPSVTSQGLEGGKTCAGKPDCSGHPCWDGLLLIVGVQVLLLSLPIHSSLAADDAHSHVG